MPEMPKLLSDLVTMINRMPVKGDEWKRLRIAVTQDELAEFREFFKQDGSPHFIWAVRGVPLYLEDHPKHPLVAMEGFNAPQRQTENPTN